MVIWLDSCASTNDEAMRRATDRSVRAVCATTQTAGRGRLGRSWSSPPDVGLYLSYIAHPRFSAKLGTALPLMAAVAVAETCATLGVRPTVKWPNDLLVNGRKLAGILCEARINAQKWHAVVGIGLNLHTPPEGWPADVPGIALDALIPTVPDPKIVAETLLERLDHWFALTTTAQSLDPVRQAWQTWAPPLGTWMRRDTTRGRFAGLAEDGALRLETDQGILVVHAGDVSILEE